MLHRRLTFSLLVASLLLPSFAFGQQQPSSPPATQSATAPTTQPRSAVQTSSAQVAAAAILSDAKNPNDPIERIKDEGLNRSQVMQVASYLTDVIGPRLTLSPNMKRANTWTRDKLTQWGLQNAQLEPWGPFGRGWSLQRFSAQIITRDGFPLIAYPMAWSPGTNGVVTAEVIHLDAATDADLERYKGRLGGAIVLVGNTREVKAQFEAPGSRATEKELLELADAPDPRQARRRVSFQLTSEQRAQAVFAARRFKFAVDENPAVIIAPSQAGDGGTLRVFAASIPQPFDTPRERRVSPWSRNATKVVPQIMASIEHYNRLVRMLKQGEKVRMSVDLAVQFHDDDNGIGYNTIAEIPGTDLKDEIVMLGAHMDSWHSGTGATDNAAGVSVVMEAVRILQALKLRPRRTIRIALWSGEEQGLLGSRAHVAKHFGTIGSGPAAAIAAMIGSGRVTPNVNKLSGYDKFSAYYNLDNGTGRIRGVYLQGNEAVRPIFREWLQPFRDMGASTLTISNTGGTDHQSFDSIGLPGFQFIQDDIEYFTRTWHTNQDLYDRLQPDDLKQSAVIMAAFVYNTSMLPEKLPRKSLSPR